MLRKKIYLTYKRIIQYLILEETNILGLIFYMYLKQIHYYLYTVLLKFDK